MHFSPRTCIIAWITNGATRAELLSSFSYTCDNLSTFFASMGNEEARKGKKGEKQSIKRTHENGLSFEANDDRADLLSNEQHLKARLSSILSYKIGLKRLQKRLIKKGINHIVYCSITRAVIAKKVFCHCGPRNQCSKIYYKKNQSLFRMHRNLQK